MKLADRVDAAGGSPARQDGEEDATLRILLADTETIYREGIQKIFALEDDIRVVARVDTLAGLIQAIQRFPTNLVLLEGRMIVGTVEYHF